MNVSFQRHFGLRPCLLWLSVLGLSACTVTPNYQRPITKLPATYTSYTSPKNDATASNALSKPSLPVKLSPNLSIPANWWNLFGDKTLNGLVAQVLQNNLDLQTAVANIEEADANLRTIRSSLFPQVNLEGSASRVRISELTAPPPFGAQLINNAHELSLSSAFELDFWGKLRRASEAARAQLLASEYAKQVSQLTLIGMTTQAYFAVRALDSQIKVTENSLSARDQSLGLVRNRAKAGLVSNLDLNQATSAQAEAAQQLKELIRQRALYEHQIAILNGNPDTSIAVGDLRNLPLITLPPSLPAQLIERRPDIKMAEQRLVAANAQVGVVQADAFPTFAVNGSYGGQSEASRNLFKTAARRWVANVGFTLPIFASGKYSARTDAARAQQKQALLAYQKSIQVAFQEVSDVLTNIEQSAAIDTDLQIRVEAARNTLKLSHLRYNSGYSAYFEVLDAERSANEAELALIRNRQARMNYAVDLVKALGGGWDSPVLTKKVMTANVARK